MDGRGGGGEVVWPYSFTQFMSRTTAVEKQIGCIDVESNFIWVLVNSADVKTTAF